MPKILKRVGEKFKPCKGDHKNSMSYLKVRVYYYDSNYQEKKVTIPLANKFIKWAEYFSYDDISLELDKYNMRRINFVDVGHVGFTQWSFQLPYYINGIISYEWL